MKLSKEKIIALAQSIGFRPDITEKVAYLLELLNCLESHPYLKDKLVLKGGTALNLFIFDIPRLSVDIDLNYIGSLDTDTLLNQKPKINQAVQSVFSREGFITRQIPQEHAGGKWQLQYQSFTGQTANLEVDLNFMFRLPLWQTNRVNSKLFGNWQAKDVTILDIHELAAGKLAALFSRCQARDLFDCHKLLEIPTLDIQKLRIAFIVYGGMNRKDWRKISLDDIVIDETDLKNQLIPMLCNTPKESAIEYGRTLANQCRKYLSSLLPFKDNELEFLQLLLVKGQIEPSILTDNILLQQNISNQPLLKWKALNVKKHLKLI